MKREKTAIIDIGSNSVRLMTATNEGLNKKYLNSTVLAEGLQSSGLLSREAMFRTTKAISDFVRLAKSSDCDKIYAFATEAVRSAKNGNDFVNAVKADCGLQIEVISGTDEAQLGFLGASALLPPPIIVIDIGGASVEIVGGDKKITYAKSLPLGVVRLTEQFGKDISKLENYLKAEILSYGNVPKAPLVAIGGTATALSAMNLGLKVYDENAVHGSILTESELNDLISRIFKSDDLIKEFPTLSPNRAKVIGQGAILLKLLLSYLNQEKITISEYDNMEGYIVYKNI